MKKSLSLRWKQQLKPRILAYLARGALRLIMMTCRREVHGLNHFKEAAKNGRCILSVWHNRVALIPEIMIRAAPEFTYMAVVSKSRDGEIIATYTESYRIGKTLRLAHDRKGEDFKRVINHLKFGQDVMILIPDGPRGPVYEVKQGIALAAHSAKAAVVPMCWEADRMLRLKSWDKMMLPKPFAKIKVTFGKPVTVDTNETQGIQKAMEEIRFTL